MIRKITFVALLIALVTATLPPIIPLPPAPGCYFDNNNLIVNGGFQNPQVSSWSTFDTIQGWASENDKIQVGKGSIYNGGGLSSNGNQVVELVSTDFTRLYQVVNLNSNTYLLKFDYACRQSIKNYQCALNLYWNEELILTLKSTDYEVKTESVVIVADSGANRITFQGVNIVNCMGMVIDNVILFSKIDDCNAPLSTKQAFYEAVLGQIKKGKQCPLC